jgi:hypothetical protein
MVVDDVALEQLLTVRPEVDRRKAVLNTPIVRRVESSFKPVNVLPVLGTPNALEDTRFASTPDAKRPALSGGCGGGRRVGACPLAC